ncbi:MAG TPA: hypothetical protein VGM62_06500 [Chthoniobacterales bacterium]|jgi:hypothetical protein
MASGSRSTNTTDLAGGGVGRGSGGGNDGSGGGTDADGGDASGGEDGPALAVDVEGGAGAGVCPSATAMARNNISVKFRINTSLSIGRDRLYGSIGRITTTLAPVI